MVRKPFWWKTSWQGVTNPNLHSVAQSPEPARRESNPNLWKQKLDGSAKKRKPGRSWALRSESSLRFIAFMRTGPSFKRSSGTVKAPSPTGPDPAVMDAPAPDMSWRSLGPFTWIQQWLWDSSRQDLSNLHQPLLFHVSGEIILVPLWFSKTGTRAKKNEHSSTYAGMLLMALWAEASLRAPCGHEK